MSLRRRRVLARLGLAVVALAWLPAAAARANVPDPNNSTVPDWIFVVGRHPDGTLDGFGTATIVVRDFANPEPGCQVRIEFGAACDLRLCTAVVQGQTVDCSSGRITGTTDSQGRFRFTVLGAATIPDASCESCLHPGPGRRAVRVIANAGTGDVELRRITAVALDQDGAAPGGVDGLTLGDVGSLLRQVGAAALLGGAYRARGDLDRDGALSIADVGALFGHWGRTSLLGGSSCGTSFCGGPACP